MMQHKYLTHFSVLIASFIFVLGSPARAADNKAVASRSAAEVAHELANPNTTLGFLANQLDYINYDGDLPGAGGQEGWRYNFQPSIPYPLGNGMNFFLRPLVPVLLDQPVARPSGFDNEGVDLGDISFDMAIGKSFPSGLQVIGGMVGTLDTAGSNLGLGQTLLGPELFLGTKTDWGFYGALVSHQWDVAGDDDFQTSITGGQYFFTYNLENAWQVQMQPTWSYNHKAAPGNRWTFPLGVGFAKTVIMGKMPVKLSLQYWNYVATPDNFGPEHQIRFQIAPVVALPW